MTSIKKPASIITTFLLSVCLAGCAAINQSQLSSAMAEVNKETVSKCKPLLYIGPEELAAVRNMDAEIHKNCSADTDGKMFTREQAPEYYECSTPIREKFKSDSASSPKAYEVYLKERKQRFADYESGKIDEKQFRAGELKGQNKYGDSAHGGSYYNWAVCKNDLMREKVLPVYGNKPLLISYLTDVEEYARNSDKKHLERADFDIGLKKLWAQFTQDEQQANAEARQQQQVIQQQNSDNLFRSLQYLQAQQPSAQPIQPMQPVQMPTLTRCHPDYMGGMNCTTQ